MLREMILVKFVFWSFLFSISETEDRPRRCSAFRSLWFRDTARLRRATAGNNPERFLFRDRRDALSYFISVHPAFIWFRRGKQRLSAV
jgi:hypothetical protein